MFGRLAARGHDVTAVVSGFRGAAANDTVDGIHVHRTGGRHSFPLAARAYVRRELRDRRFDIIIEDLNKIPLFTPLWTDTPIVLLVHHLFGLTAFQEASLPVAATTWLAERPLARVYRDVPVEVVSDSTAEDLVARGFDRGRIRIIPNGVDLEFYSPDPSLAKFPEPTLLYLGRLKKYKRVDLVLQAVAHLRGNGVPVRLLVAGRGDQREALEALSARLGLTGSVEFLGFVDEGTKRTLLRRAWVHVLASPKEGWGISNVEAAACGTPTVASDAPGLRDSVVDGTTGLLVPHGDVAALAGAIRRIVEDAAFRLKLSHGARAFAEGFGWERAADSTEAHLQEVIT